MQASHQRKRRATMSNKLSYHSPIREPEPPWFCNPCPPAANPYPTLDSPISGSCITDENSDLRYKLKEIETVMLGPDQTTSISPTTTTTSFNDYRYSSNDNEINESNENEDWGRIADAIARRDVKQVLISCARAVSENDLMMAHWLIDELRRMVSVSGEPAQRLGAYMLEGLVARLGSSGSIICKEPQLSKSSETLSHTTHVLHELCPYFKFGYMSANGAIAEAMRCEDRVHIVDFQIGRGSQWVTLIQAFAGRPGGPPRIRITGIGGPGLEGVGKRLARLAEAVKVPFEFSAVSGPEKVAVRRGGNGEEAVAVNFAFALHRAADESVTTENRRDRLIRLAKGFNPKVLTLVEQESNTNTSAFLPRFGEALGYYSAMFESIDEALPRDHRERIGVEQQCLAREVVNIVACEGVERVERHELLGKWRSRLGMAGFRPSPLSSLVNATIKTLLESYSNKYRLEERDGALYLGWMDRFLVTCSAWRL